MCAVLSHSVMELEVDGEPAHLEHFQLMLLCHRAVRKNRAGFTKPLSHPHVPTASLAYTRSTPMTGARIEAEVMCTNRRCSASVSPMVETFVAAEPIIGEQT